MVTVLHPGVTETHEVAGDLIITIPDPPAPEFVPAGLSGGFAEDPPPPPPVLTVPAVATGLVGLLPVPPVPHGDPPPTAGVVEAPPMSIGTNPDPPCCRLFTVNY